MKPHTPKNIIVLCDGTANQATVYTETNVVRIAEMLDKKDNIDSRQVLFYDPGLGTESTPGALTYIGQSITKFLGLAFGYGLAKNLADAYAFLMQNYEPGDRIYIFGFSRGAYTARALTGLLGRVGLLDRGCNSLIPYAIKYYREGNSYKLNLFKKRFSRTYALKWGEVIAEPQNDLIEKDSKGVIPVHFLGVWDTVKSIGLMRRKATLLDTDWLPNMINGRHAVAIDEKRSQYQPELWHSDTDSDHKVRKEERKSNLQICLHQDVKTLWFPGVHADVGGGYGLTANLEKELIQIKVELKKIDWELLPKARRDLDTVKVTKFEKLKKVFEDRKKRIEQNLHIETALAYNSLEWMTEAAKKFGLLFEKEKKKDIKIENPKQHNPLKPFWWILGWKTRPLPKDKGKIWTK